MTLQDAARLVGRDYAAAADRTAGLCKAAAEVAKAIEYNERVQRADQEQGNQRWQQMGFVRQVMHKTGAHRDQALSNNEAGEGQAVSELLKLDVRRAELAQQVPQAEKAEAAAFGAAKPAATAELAQRQEGRG
jgi:predicted mannosyl-3-phosphoglycerate phosphatase (HAD superfamily)